MSLYLKFCISLKSRKYRLLAELLSGSQDSVPWSYISSLAISSVTSTIWPRREIKQNIHFLSQIICNSFKFSFIIMSLKMPTLCLDASPDTLRPVCCHHMHCLQGDLCHCLQEGSPQAVVMLSASHVLQNSPQFTVQGFEVWTPWGPILGTDEGQEVPSQPLLSHLGLVGRSWVLLGDPFLIIEEGHVKMFRNSL